MLVCCLVADDLLQPGDACGWICWFAAVHYDADLATLLQTASLICDACKSCAILSGHAPDSEIARAAEAYGFHLGLAYQIIDDVLDFTVASDVLGKPVSLAFAPCADLLW